MRGKVIPAFAMSGGLLSNFGGKKAVLEYRIWIHDQYGRLDFRFNGAYFWRHNLKELIKMRKALLKDKKIFKVEQPLAVVWDKNYENYREVLIDGINYE